MTEKQKQELDEALTDLVERIYERGRLSVAEERGEIGVRDGGPALAKLNYVQQLKSYARTEALSLANKVVGADVEVEAEYASIMDEERTPSAVHLAINQIKNQQRFIIHEYEHGPRPQPEPKDLTEMERVDPTKPALELVGVPGTDQLSENEA